MIQLTRINLVPFYLNPDLIEHLETTPDTVISLTTGQKFVVVESPEQVISRIVDFRRRVHTLPPTQLRLRAEDPREE